MIKPNHILALAVALLIQTQTQAATTPASPKLQPEDFATGSRLQVQGKGQEPFYRIILPPEVYTGTAYPDLRDLRVFNGDGEVVPYALISPAIDKAPLRRVVLQSFQLTDKSDDNGSPRIEVQTQGLTVHIAGEHKSVRRAEYLLSLPQTNGGDRPNVKALHLDWAAKTGNWQQRVTVEGSDDLRKWSTILVDQPLMDLKNGTQRLVQKDIEFSERQFWRYWRLSFGEIENAGAAPELRSVEASLDDHRPSPSYEKINATLLGADEHGASYTLPSPQWISRLRILPQQANSVLPIRIEYRLDSKDKWLAWGDTVAYRLSSPQGERLSPPARNTGDVLARELRLTPIGPGWGAQAPQLVAERETRHVVFNARGGGPWLLAWGSRVADDASLPLETLIQQNREEAAFFLIAEAEPAQALGGTERLTALSPAERRQNQHAWLVWIGLIAGALALAALALRVWKETRLPAA